MRNARSSATLVAVAVALGGTAQGAGVASGAAPQGGTPMTVNVRLLDSNGKLAAAKPEPKVVKSDAEWRAQLTPEQMRIARGQGTEPAFCGAFFDHKKPGLYTCVCCGLPLFESSAKFDSGTGWPSFFKPVCPENVTTRVDRSFGMSRTEILCARCEAHMGHVFDDGPPPTGLRYCLNSASLTFTASTTNSPAKPAATP